ncbi:MAG: hypothetical protein HQ488_00065 [Parcubacteria group bacterium]|nr:hypothetical protein [Parcubacteria group bacterium]
MSDLDWIFELKNKVPAFLRHLEGHETPGFFKYSLTGDLFDETDRWGLGNTVFAIKCYYTLNLLETLPSSQLDSMIKFIKSFQKDDGFIFDPLIRRRAFFREKLSALKQNDFQNFFHQKIIRAETRQSISSLLLLGQKPDYFPLNIPNTRKAINTYLSKLNWKSPWGAGSHFSHLLFFLANSDLLNKEELVDYSINWVNRIQDKDSGSWFKGEPSVVEKINGAMKVLTGFKAADKMKMAYPEQMIDLALGARNDRHACDNFNVIYVLKYANEATNGSYRLDEIKQFAHDRLSIYHEYYWPEHGGFSFHKGRANTYYYKAIITKGLPEPDVHGTVLFLWGISLIAQILNIDKELGFKEFVT